MFNYRQLRIFLHEPIGKIVLSRWVISALFLPLVLLNRVYGIFPQLTTIDYMVDFLAIVILLSLLLSVLSYIAVIRQWRTVIFLGALHIILDIAIITFITYFSGAAESELFAFYIFPILFSLILFFDNRAAYFILLCVVSYIGMVYLDETGVLAHQSSDFARQLLNHDIRAVNMKILFLVQISLGVLFVVWMIRRIMNDREYRLTREKQNMQTLVEAIPEGLVMVNQYAEIVMCNEIAEDILGLPLPSDDQLFILPRSSDGSQCSDLYQLLRMQPVKPQLDKEVRVRCNENVQHLTVDTIPIVEEKKYPRLWLHILHDLTEQNAFDQIKSDFVSIAAHQLRTPLSGLKWFFDQLIEDGEQYLPLRQMGHVLGAQEQNEKIIEMVNDLLHISEIEAEETTMRMQPLEVRDVLGTAAHSIQPKAKDANVSIDIADTDGQVSGDMRQLHILFSNVLENAIKYSETGSKVRVRVQHQHGRVRFHVEDEGIGIPKEDQERVFMKFFRTQDAQRREQSGSGLGLYIVRKIAQAHGGNVRVESVEGEGTTFIIDLPE